MTSSLYAAKNLLTKVLDTDDLILNTIGNMKEFYRVLGPEKFSIMLSALMHLIKNPKLDAYDAFCKICNTPVSEGGIDLSEFNHFQSFRLAEGFGEKLAESNYYVPVIDQLVK